MKNIFHFSELSPEAKDVAIKNEILFQLSSEDRPDGLVNSIAGHLNDVNEKVSLLFKKERQFFIDCIVGNGDYFLSDGTIASH